MIKTIKCHSFFKNPVTISLFFLLTILFSCTSSDQKEKPIKTTDGTPAKVNLTSLDTSTPDVKKTEFIPFDSTITTAYLIGQFDPAQDKDFILIEKKYASRTGMYLNKQTYEAFQKMFDAAQKDGISLIIKSATRPFIAQKKIWEDKWTGKRLVEDGQNISKTVPDPKQRALKILEYSSMPGTSRHHWGTDIDLNDFTNTYFEKGRGLKEYQWLQKHAATYGFCQPYTAKGTDRPDGYNEEKWHWSYMPIARNLTRQYKLRLNNSHIQGFKGAETAANIQVVEKYVLGINTECL